MISTSTCHNYKDDYAPHKMICQMYGNSVISLNKTRYKVKTERITWCGIINAYEQSQNLSIQFRMYGSWDLQTCVCAQMNRSPSNP